MTRNNKYLSDIAYFYRITMGCNGLFRIAVQFLVNFRDLVVEIIKTL